MTTVRLNYYGTSKGRHFFMYGFVFFGLLGLMEGFLLHDVKLQFYMYTYFPARMKAFDRFEEAKTAYIQAKLEKAGYQGSVDSFQEFKRLLFNLINDPAAVKARQEKALAELKKKLEAEKREDERLTRSLTSLEQQMDQYEVKQRQVNAEMFKQIRVLEKEEAERKQ